MNKRLALGLTTAALGALLVVGVSGPADARTTTTATDHTHHTRLTDLPVATITIEDAIPLTIGQEKGFFAKHGLHVTTTVSPAFDGTLADVLNGQASIGFAASAPLLNALAKNAPVKVVAQTASFTKGNDGFYVEVDGNSITRPRDLDGKTVAVAALNNLTTVGVQVLVAKDGGNASSVKFVELPAAQMLPALLQGKVQAAAIVPPQSVAALKTKGVRVLLQYADGFPAGGPLDEYFASTSFISSHRAELRSFRAGMNEAVAYANTHPQAIRNALKAIYTGLPGGAAAAQTQPLMKFSTAINTHSLTVLEADMKKYAGLAKTVPSSRFYSFTNGH